MRRTTLATVLLLSLSLIALGFAMARTARDQRHAATRAANRTTAVNRLMLATVDQETGLRGYLLTGKDDFLAPFRSGEGDVRTAERDIRAAADGDAETLTLLDRFGLLQRQWADQVAGEIRQVRRDGRWREDLAVARSRKDLMDRLRRLGADLNRHLDARRDADLKAAGRRAVTSIVALNALLALIGAGAAARQRQVRRRVYQRELGYRTRQREFTGVIQVVRSEPEAHGLLKRHLELALPGASATVLVRNNSDNRLVPSTPVPAGTALAEHLDGAEPSACVAVRLGRRHEEDAGDQRLLTCGICGAQPGSSVCEPLLVGGQVIGSVLVQDAPAGEGPERHLADSVAQAAPVLANLRNLALAERQASTDALTGLPNRRAVQDALARMVAQAHRSGRPLAAIALDLDHFKDVNDHHGHDMGDAVLAQVGTLLPASVRAGDLVGRVGGEEFIVLAPDTDVDGALTLAETLRAALAAETVPGLGRSITGSFGVAVLPDHAAGADALLRLADRALYAAKEAGRDRVELVAAPAPPSIRV